MAQTGAGSRRCTEARGNGSDPGGGGRPRGPCGFLLAGHDLHAGPAGVIPAFGRRQREQEGAQAEPQGERHQQQAETPVAFTQRHQPLAGPVERQPGRIRVRDEGEQAVRLGPRDIGLIPESVEQVAHLTADQAERGAQETQDLGGAARRQDAHHQHDQQGREPGRSQRERDHDQQDQRVIQEVVTLGDAQPEQDRQAEEGDQAEVGQDGLQQLGDEDRPDGDRGGQQEVHIAGEVERLQQDAEAGHQDAQEQGGEDERRHGLQEGGHIQADVLGELGRAQEFEQQPAPDADADGKGQQAHVAQDDEELLDAFGVLEAVEAEAQAQPDELPDRGQQAVRGGGGRWPWQLISRSRRWRLPPRRRSGPGRYPPG